MVVIYRLIDRGLTSFLNFVDLKYLFSPCRTVAAKSELPATGFNYPASLTKEKLVFSNSCSSIFYYAC